MSSGNKKRFSSEYTVLDPSMETLLAAQPLGKAAGCGTLLSELGGGTGIGDILGGLTGN